MQANEPEYYRVTCAKADKMCAGGQRDQQIDNNNKKLGKCPILKQTLDNDRECFVVGMVCSFILCAGFEYCIIIMIPYYYNIYIS